MRSFGRTNNALILWIALLCLVFLIYHYAKVYEAQKLKKKNEIIFSSEMHNNEYCIVYNYLEATETFREDGLEPISLAVHGTSDTLISIEKKPFNWDGPISVGLFIDFHSRAALEYISDLHQCIPEFQRKVSVHFVYRVSPLQNQCDSMKISVPITPCEVFLKNQVKKRGLVDGPFQMYPINLMRNVARKGAKSDLHFIIDADMIMSEQFAIRVKPVANQMIDGKKKNVLVIRRFETNEKKIPRNYVDLEESFGNKKVLEFHQKFLAAGHRISNISAWFEQSTQFKEIKFWEIPYTNSEWEVQVILHRNDPYNPDYFPSRIRDMQSLIYSLCRANYKFNLLSQVFNIHEGIKTENTMYSKVVADYSKKYGRTKALNRFVKEMNTAYPDTLKKCGKFSM